MTGYNKENGRTQQPIAPLMQKAHFYDQQNYAKAKKYHWDRAVVVFGQPVVQRIDAYEKGNTNHKVFKMKIFYNIYPKQR